MKRTQLRRRRAQAMIEYIILVGLMAAFSFRVASKMGHELSDALGAMSNQLTTQVTDVMTGRRPASGG